MDIEHDVCYPILSDRLKIYIYLKKERNVNNKGKYLSFYPFYGIMWLCLAFYKYICTNCTPNIQPQTLKI